VTLGYDYALESLPLNECLFWYVEVSRGFSRSAPPLRDFVVLCFAKPEAFAERFGGIRLAFLPRRSGKKRGDG
jgi:hypothetical protein